VGLIETVEEKENPVFSKKALELKHIPEGEYVGI